MRVFNRPGVAFTPQCNPAYLGSNPKLRALGGKLCGWDAAPVETSPVAVVTLKPPISGNAVTVGGVSVAAAGVHGAQISVEESLLPFVLLPRAAKETKAAAGVPDKVISIDAGRSFDWKRAALWAGAAYLAWRVLK